MGTAAFMPPEQLRGEEVGPPGDVFSLGCLLAYAATGRSPFGDGAAHAVTYRIVHQEPDLAGLPDRLAETVGRCLAKDRNDRPSPEQVLEECGEAVGDGRPPEGEGWLPDAVTEVVTAHKTMLLTLVDPEDGKPPARPKQRKKKASGKSGGSKGAKRSASSSTGDRSKGSKRAGEKKPKAPGTRASWSTTAVLFRGRNHESFTYVLPPGGGTGGGAVWGDGVYSDDSSVGLAAVHAGLITLKDGGRVTFTIRPSRKSYPSATRHGIRSSSWGEWSGSFKFLPSAGDEWKPPARAERWTAAKSASAAKSTSKTTSTPASEKPTEKEEKEGGDNSGWWFALAAAVVALLLYANHPGSPPGRDSGSTTAPSISRSVTAWPTSGTRWPLRTWRYPAWRRTARTPYSTCVLERTCWRPTPSRNRVFAPGARACRGTTPRSCSTGPPCAWRASDGIGSSCSHAGPRSVRLRPRTSEADP